MKRILPAQFDNHYRGHVSALWILALITTMTLAQSAVHLFTSDGGALSIAHIPLDTYSAGAAQNLVALYARLGLGQCLMGVLCLVALRRYRAMIPLLYVVLVLGYVAQWGVAQLKPTVTVGVSGASAPAVVLTTLGIVGLVQSLRGQGYRIARADSRKEE
ncbi:MAG: hypothetical protein HY824_01890 [Acidobacteria bacterium]|nr:hypothetical protein [Acidobacteriota bacterium]